MRVAVAAGMVLCLFMLVFGLAASGWEVKLPLLALSIPGVVALFLIDERLEARERKRTEESNARRVDELLEGLPAAGFELVVRGWFGQRAIVLSAAGFEAPSIPLMPWSEVDGVALHGSNIKGVSRHMLCFRIDNLPQLIGRCGLNYRLLYPLRRGAGRKTLGVGLVGTSEPPAVVYGVARHLWTRATGKRHDWRPMLSDEVNAAMRQSSEALARMQGIGVDQALRDPAEHMRLAASMRAANQVVMDTLRRKLRAGYWIAGIGALVLVVLITLAIMKP